MTDVAIEVENLGKRYRINPEELGASSTLEAAKRLLTSPFSYLRRITRPPREDELLWAIRDLSFTVEQGEVLGIIGPNGAGKSTLLKVLSHITEPTEGSAKMRGRIGSLLEVGTGFHPELTGRENVYLNGAILGMSREEIDGKFDDIVDFSGVRKFIDTPVKRYSSGMAVRLAFSVAAHLDVNILLVDEVLAVGDEEFQRKSLGKMDDARHDGKTVIFVSHSMGSVAELCDRCILLRDGHIVEQGAPKVVIERYLSSRSPVKGRVDLTTWHEDFRGEGPRKLEYLELRDRDGKVRAQYAYGEPITFNMGISGTKGDICLVAVSVLSNHGQRILHLCNTDEEARLVLPADKAEVSVELPVNILNDGRYYVKLWLADGINSMNDLATNCLSFVVDSSAEGSVRSMGLVRSPSHWDVRKQPQKSHA